MEAWDLIKLDNGMNFFYLFLNYLAVLIIAIVLTKVFKYLKHHPKIYKNK